MMPFRKVPPGLNNLGDDSVTFYVEEIPSPKVIHSCQTRITGKEVTRAQHTWWNSSIMELGVQLEGIQPLLIVLGFQRVHEPGVPTISARLRHQWSGSTALKSNWRLPMSRAEGPSHAWGLHAVKIWMLETRLQVLCDVVTFQPRCDQMIKLLSMEL